jgi:hypothetical protein
MRAGTLVDRCDRCNALLVRMNPRQHAAAEAIYEDMAAQLDFPEGSGEMLEAWEWHQVMVGSYAKMKGWLQKILPTIDGGGMVPVMRTKQSRLTKAQGSELIEFCKAYAVGRGAEVREWDQDGNLIAGAPLNALRRAA